MCHGVPVRVESVEGGVWFHALAHAAGALGGVQLPLVQSAGVQGSPQPALPQQHGAVGLYLADGRGLHQVALQLRHVRLQAQHVLTRQGNVTLRGGGQAPGLCRHHHDDSTQFYKDIRFFSVFSPTTTKKFESNFP